VKKVALCIALVALLSIGNAMAATEETKQTAIDSGLGWLASTQTISGAEGYWSYPNDGTVAATASAALAFIEEGYLPGDASIYDDVITRAVTYLFNRATIDGRFGVETAGYERYAEDYDNDGVYDDGNDEAIYFEPGNSARRVYTTGLVAPVVYALGNALGTGTVVGVGSAAISGKTYAQAMQDIVDWFSWGQVEPNRGVYRGGWRYDANYSDADNSTAQWGALPLLYAADWGLGVPQYVFDELELWVNYIQNANGGSGYNNPTTYVNVSKTGGLLLELAAIGAPATDGRVVAALNFINGRWNTVPSGVWYGNLNHPYAMWAVYKGLQVYGLLVDFDCGGPDIPIGVGMPAAPGGFSICFDASPVSSLAGDWYSHYCDYLCGIQAGDGSWAGYSNWVGALAVGWYINILNAVPIPPPCIDVYVDIKPTSCPNPLNTNSRGVLPVAILGTETFDVATVDPATVRLAGVAPLRWNYEDVATPFMGELCDCHELGPDGYMDMTLKFKTQDIVAALEAMNSHALVSAMKRGEPSADGGVLSLVVGPREYVHLPLTGETLDGDDICGEDCVRVMWKTRGPEGPDGDGGPGVSGETTTVSLGVLYPRSSGSGLTIAFSLSEAAHVTLSVYDVAGRRVKTLVSRTMPAGASSVAWNGDDDSGTRVAAGVYFVKMNAAGLEKSTKLILLK
jgi:hypothetical protein